MRRYIKYILLSLITFFAAVSCIEEMESPLAQGSDQLTIVPRVTSFTNQYVTKAYDATAEGRINKLAVLVFNSVGDGELIYFKEVTENISSVSLNKAMFNRGDNATYTIVMMANMNLASVKKSDGTKLSDTAANKTVTLADMENYICHFSSTFLTAVPEAGFPMIGGVKGVKFSLTEASTDPISINLTILFAKINLEIAVEKGAENSLNDPTFTLTGANITNLAKATPLAVPNEEGMAPKDFLGNPTNQEGANTAGYTDDKYIDTDEETKAITFPSSSVSLGNTITSTFYIAENRYNHGGTDGVYPSSWGTSDLYNNYKQQYKPKLAEKTGGEGLPTYITLTGEYTDYRSTKWGVTYTVYLGKNNYDNFHIDRNSEYSNKITIKGLRNNDSYKEYDEDGNLIDQHVWIDHRVNVTLGNNQGADNCVTITRETLIDAHIEVRPLRVNLTGSKYTEVAIYLPMYPKDGDGNIIYNNTTNPSSWGQLDENMVGNNENWIAIENNNGLSNKGRLYCSNGKRKYFTTSLIEELHAESSTIKIDNSGNKYISLNNGDCAWIYFDENATSNTRRAKIDVVFYYTEEGTKKSVTESYHVYQSGYTPIGDTGLKIENYEEYLHSYDSEDNYITTLVIDHSQMGLPWGFLTKPISKNMIVSPMELSPINLGLTQPDPRDYIPEEVRYDYFHQKDGDSHFLYNKNGNNWENATFGTGLDFTKLAGESEGLTVINMETLPQSAYEYCLSKNKFNEDADGNHTMVIHWYLPDVYELNALFANSNTYEDLENDIYYWSSQPSYTNYGLSSLPVVGEYLSGYSIKNEVQEKARAVSKLKIEDQPRKNQNRIRCFYSSQGVLTDMSDRVPSGLGGLIKVNMKAYQSYVSADINVPGFFSAWLVDIDEPDKPTTPSKQKHKFPTGTDANNLDHFTSNGVYYYEKDPTTSGAWNRYTLNSYPGLTVKDVDYDTFDGGYIESSTDKKYTRTLSEVNGEQITVIPSNTALENKPLDYLENSDILTISFSNGTNRTKSPSYSYRREDLFTVTYTQKWILPQYTSVDVNETTGKNQTVQVEWSVYNNYITYYTGADYVYNGETHKIKDRKKEGSIFSGGVTYYFILEPKVVNRPGYKYVQNTGGWGNSKNELGKEDQSSKSTIETKYDKLELFGGNSFTIKAKKGYRIRSIKVNFSDDNAVKNITGDLIDVSYRNLRLVTIDQKLPTTSAPDYMSYSGDGQSGWFVWTAPTVDDYASSVTLKLVAYVPGEGTNIFRPTSFQYVEPSNATGYQSDLETSIVIDSFEIRIEEVEESTHTE